MSRILDFFKGIISLALVLAFLVGVPAVLLIIIGYPLPTEIPPIEVIRGHIEGGNIPSEFVVKTLAIVVWLVWMQLAVAILTELFALARGKVAGRAPVVPGMQLFAGKLVASTVLIISALTPSRSAVAAPITPIPVEEVVDAGVSAIADPAIETGRNGTMPRVSLMPQQQTRAEVSAGQYQTESSDSWWDMAERLLGDGMRWSELRDLNSGKTMLNGEVITERTETVRGGWLLEVPADANQSLLRTPGAAVATGVQADAEADAEADALPEVPLYGDPGTILAEQTPAPEQDTLAALAGADQTDAEQVEAGKSGSLLDAIKPYTLVYEGPTGAVDEGPGVPYQVAEGDNLWDIAEAHLGDPFRWPEIFERSQDLQQSFGREINDPNLIWPDSILWLPSDAVNVPVADADLVADVLGPITPVAPEDQTPTEVTPESLESAADAAAEALPVSDPGPADLPSGPGGGSDGPPDGSRSSESTDIDLTQPSTLAFGAGGSLVAAGLLGLVRRNRRLRLAEAGDRSQPAPPPMELVDIETVLRDRAGDGATPSVHSALRSLVDRPIVVDEPLAAPEVIRLSSDRIEVIQNGDEASLPAPWIAGKDESLDALGGRSLAVLPAEFFPDEPADGYHQTVPAPMTVTVAGGMLLNLESLGVVALDGAVEISAGLIRSMVHELATGPARRSIDIRVSNWLPGADLHEHVRCGSLDNLVGELQPWLQDVELALAASGGYSAYALRAGGIPSSMPNPKVIFADAADAPAIMALVGQALRHAVPLAVVFSGDLSDLGIRPSATLALDNETLRLEPYGFTAAMQYLDVDLILGVEALVNHSRQAPMIPRVDEQSTILPLSEHETDPAQVGTEETPEHELETELPAEEHEVTDQAEDADGGILIRVLGPVEFEGGPEDLTEDERSLLTFLALVGPSTADQVKDAVWPGGRIGDAAFEATVERLRERLRHQFPDAGDGRYRVRSIITDLGSARRWIAQAEAMSPDRARNLLQLALTDIRGTPFTGVSEQAWQWVADHKMAIGTQASTMLMDACFDLCDNAYEANDIHIAAWACDVAALLDPIHETVITRRVQLMQVMGRHQEAEAAVAAWEAAYFDVASRPAPRGPREALEAGAPAAEAPVEAPYVG